MKKIIFLLLAFVVFKLNAQHTEIDFEIPQGFFNEMFRDPSDKYLVAWHGGVTTIVKNKAGQEIQVTGVIQIIEDYLNAELTKLGRRQFKFNLNTPLKRITTPNDKSWAGHCGYNPFTGITFNDIMNGTLAGWPSEITSEPWALRVSKKTVTKGTYKNNKTGKREVISVYFHANSTFYYHKIKPQSLKGQITRDDDYKACGKIAMNRLGPGQKEFKDDTAVIGGEFEFSNQLFLGDYQVQYFWEDGSYQELTPHVVYNPFGVLPEEVTYKLKTYVGTIKGTLVDKETHKPVANQKVTLKPFCDTSELPEQETNTNEDGEYEFTEVPNGVYTIVTKGAPNTMAGLTKNPILRLREIEVKQQAKYDILVTYTAPGFAKAKLLWANATIKFPDDDEKIQFFDMMAFRASGNYDNPTGTDGEPLKIPYTTVIPGIGKQTLYGWPENENATPEVIFVASLGGYKVYDKFKINLSEDALNTCNISQIGNGPIYLDLNFDLTARYPLKVAPDGLWQQEDVGCKEDKEWNMTKGNSLNGYPLAFKQIKFTDAEIEKFKNSEEFESVISNGKATLKVVFKPLDNE